MMNGIDIKNRITSYINKLIPQNCSLCSITMPACISQKICSECTESLPTIESCCGQCSESLNPESATEDVLCGTCITNNRYWVKCYANYLYEHPIDKLIRQFKYENRIDLAAILASYIYNSIENNYDQLPDLLTYVPMHANRLASRGYNHSLLLAKHVSASLNVKMEHLLIKTKDTSSQTKLNSRLRITSMANSFSINKNTQQPVYKNKTIAIIDDVVTTGATSSEIAKTLLKSGAKEVHIWCIVRS